jgi:hypothetical protein
MMEKNQSCFLVHFVVRARSFPKINTFLVLGSLDSVEKRNAPTTKWGRDEKDLWAKLSHRHGAFLHRQGQIDMLPFTQVSRHVLCSPFE